jgi:hypothetical protein
MLFEPGQIFANRHNMFFNSLVQVCSFALWLEDFYGSAGQPCGKALPFLRSQGYSGPGPAE